MAVVKAQVDFIRGKVPDAEVVLHPYSGEAGADRRRALRRPTGAARRGVALPRLRDHRGADLHQHDQRGDRLQVVPDQLHARRSSTSSCRAPKGREWSKLPLAAGWERVISGNSCPKGLVEDVNEMRVVKAKLEEVKREYPNVAEMVRKDAFRRVTAAAVAD